MKKYYHDKKDDLMPAERRYGLDVTIYVRTALKDAYSRGQKDAVERIKKNDNRYAKFIFEKLVDPIIRGRLTPKEDEMIRMRFIEGKTLEETGKKFGVTRERVRQVEARIIAKIANLPEVLSKEGRLALLAELALKPIDDPQVKQLIEKKKKEEYTPVEVLHLSSRPLNALLNHGLGSVEKLCNSTVDQIAGLRGIGVNGIKEIINALAKSGRVLKIVEELQRNELGKYYFSFGTENALLNANIRAIEEITELTFKDLSMKIGEENAMEVKKKIFDTEKWHLKNPNPPSRE